MWNKEKCTGNQQWWEGNQDLYQRFGPEGDTNIQPEQDEETRVQKNEERLRNLQDNFKCLNIWIIGVPEGEEQEQEVENLFEKTMKENVLICQRNRLPGSPGSSESPKEVRPKEAHTKAHHNYISQDER